MTVSMLQNDKLLKVWYKKTWGMVDLVTIIAGCGKNLVFRIKWQLERHANCI